MRKVEKEERAKKKRGRECVCIIKRNQMSESLCRSNWRLRNSSLGQLCQDLSTLLLKLSNMILDALGDKLGGMVLGIAIDKGAVGSHEVEEDGMVDEVVLSGVDLGGFGEVDAV